MSINKIHALLRKEGIARKNTRNSKASAGYSLKEYPNEFELSYFSFRAAQQQEYLVRMLDLLATAGIKATIRHNCHIIITKVGA